MDNLLILVKALIDKIDEVHLDSRYAAVWHLARLHGCEYDGPTYTNEFNALRDYVLKLERNTKRSCDA